MLKLIVRILKLFAALLAIFKRFIYYIAQNDFVTLK